MSTEHFSFPNLQDTLEIPLRRETLVAVGRSLGLENPGTYPRLFLKFQADSVQSVSRWHRAFQTLD